MGLRIIYGKSGTGKSEYCFQEIAKKIENKEKIFLITPEQFSFTAEQKLMEKLGKEAIIQAEVIHLSRLAKRVSKEIGNNQPKLTKSGKAMLVSHIFTKNKNKLKYLSKSKDNIELAISSITEFKKHGITKEKLEDQIEKTENIYLKTKLEDILIIYKNYEEMLEKTYIDEIDELEVLANNIYKIKWLKNSTIYIDEFAGFTYPEYRVIEELIKYTKEVNITITTNNLKDNTNPDKDIFYANKQTVKKLREILKNNELKEEKPIKLEKLVRFKNEELKHIEENLFEIKSEKKEIETKNIDIFLAKNQYTEIENVARKITKEIREEKLRYKDISIITKNIESYASLAKVIFEKYEIPIFIDQKRELSQNIIIQYILSILEILRKNYSKESVFQYLKLGFTNIQEEDIFRLENYCTKWGIKQNKFKKDFKYEEETKKEEIKYLNELRKEIINPLEELKENIKEQKTAKEITKNLYKFLEKQEIEEKIKEKIKKLQEKNKTDLIQEYKESYEIIINLLDEIVEIFNEEKITIDEYIAILKQGLKSSSLGKIPGTQDQVIMGDVDRSRSHKVKSVYIIGLNDGVYPSVNKNEGFINDEERNYLKDQGITLAKGTLENLYDDNFNIYKAFTTAENKIHLSYCLADTEGKTLRQSIYISRIKKIFPKIKQNSDVITPIYEITTKKATYEQLIEKIAMSKEEKIEIKWKEVYNYFKNEENWKEKIKEDIKGLKYTNIPEKISKETIEKLYGNTIKTSISKLEKYKSCPFSYFLEYGLKLKPKEELQIQNFETGSFMHEIIDIFFTKIQEEKEELTSYLDNDEKIEKEVKKIIETKLDYKKYKFIVTVKYKILVKRLIKVVSKALKYILESLIYSEFKVQGSEIEFGTGKKHKPIILELENGKNVEIQGKIDRMDIAKTEEGNYIRIIDYKSSAKDIDLNKVYAGLQIQLITYLDAICEKQELIPAGALYFSLLEPMVKTNKKLDEEEIEEKLRENYKMKGLILANVNVIKMQDTKLEEGKKSNIIPAKIGKNGKIDERSTKGINEEEFEKLQKYIKKLIKEIGNEIIQGKIDLKPTNYKGEKPCKYCKYHSICGFDIKNQDNKYTYIEKLTKDDIMKKIGDN